MTAIRGSLLLGIMKQGVSESFSAVSPTFTNQQMLGALNLILRRRFALSNSVQDKNTVVNNTGNNLSIVATRANDQLVPRKIAIQTQNTPGGYNQFLGNMEGNLTAKLNWTDVNGITIAVTYLHGIPVAAIAPFETTSPIRTPSWDPRWVRLLTAYVTSITGAGLGFPTINNSPTNALGPITAVVYNAVSGLYTITTTNPVPSGKFRVALRGFRSLRILNGRKAAQGTGTTTFVVFRPGPNIAWDNTGTAVPLSGYNGGVRFWNYLVVPPYDVEPTLLVPKKLGRPFFLQRGRLSRKPA